MLRERIVMRPGRSTNRPYRRALVMVDIVDGANAGVLEDHVEKAR